ncbi:ROK family protein [Kribbella soli]|uniref:ROK family protein n=1 Tax=Kribbella soli TaxID=1124743 RepID=A0A4R0H8A1_9ACTN|nr:ROK family protein [Kribbella soli]TCC06263.1 ROK family protein [Kribbella soli]
MLIITWLLVVDAKLEGPAVVTGSFPRAATDQTLLRRVNELSVLAALRGNEPRPLREVADATGLSWRSAQVVTEKLGAQGWLAETEADAGDKRMGRPARRYRFRAEVGYAVGLDVGPRQVRVIIADLAATVVSSQQVDVSPEDTADARLAIAEQVLRAALSAAGIQPDDVWAAALGTSGVVAPDGTITSVLLPGWTGLNPGTRLAAALPCPVAVVNDANLAALAERWRGFSAETMIYLLVGMRLGAGLVVGGSLHTGSGGAAGEIGMLRELGWHDAARRLAATPIDALTMSAEDSDLAAMRVFQAARDAHPAALAAVDRFAADVARGVAAMVLTVDPELVVLGGSFSHAADLLLPRLEALLAETCLHTPRLAASELGDNAVAYGALRLALDTVNQRMTSLDSATPLIPAAIRGY